MKPLWGLCALLVFSSCSTSTKVTGLSELPNLGGAATGVAIPVALDASDRIISSAGCTFLLLKKGSLGTYQIEFNPGNDVLFAELPPGTYSYKEIVCSQFHWDLTFRNWPRFEVYPGKISVVGGIALSLASLNNMAIRLSNRQKNRDDTLRLLGRIATGLRERLVSGYTGQAIDAQALARPAEWRRWKVSEELGSLEVAPKRKSWPSFHACYRGENEVNGLWLGDIQLDAVYDKGGLVREQPGRAWNTFTPHFTHCVQEALKDFHPLDQARLHYKIYL